MFMDRGVRQFARRQDFPPFAPLEKIPRASACIAARPCLSCGRKSDKFILQNIMIYENILQKTTPMNQSYNQPYFFHLMTKSQLDQLIQKIQNVPL